MPEGKAVDVKQAFQKQAQDHVPIGRKEFEHNDQRWIYDFDIITLEQRESARAVYLFGLELTKTPPAGLDKLFLSGGHNITLRAMAYLIRRIGPDGKPQNFSPEQAQGEALEFMRGLPAAMTGDLVMECQDDFFFRANVPDLELIRHLRSYAAAEEGARATVQGLVRDALLLSKRAADSATSTVEAKSAAASSTKGGTPRSSGKSRKATRAASNKRGK